MTKATTKNVGAAIRARLLHRSRERGEDFQLLLLRYANERLLFRLATSKDADVASRAHFSFRGRPNEADSVAGVCTQGRHPRRRQSRRDGLRHRRVRRDAAHGGNRAGTSECPLARRRAMASTTLTLRDEVRWSAAESSPHKTPKSSRVSSRSLSTSPYALISNRSRSSRMPGIAMYQCSPWL